MAKVVAMRRAPTKRRSRPKLVHQFLVVLTGTDPLVWRRLQVPQTYSFWDLHVAIQDAMGWLDYHLHEFRLLDMSAQQVLSIGIPDDEEFADRVVLPGWQVTLSSIFDQRSNGLTLPLSYTYDFGDDWEHVLVHEGFETADDEHEYPRCISGSGRCPPEDCGGVHGYADLLQILSDPKHPEYKTMRQWAGGPIQPQAFNPAAVKFDDPKKRWRRAFERQH